MELELTKKYHLVITEEMYEKLNSYSKKKSTSVNKTLQIITKTMIPMVDYYTFFQSESSDFGYSEIDAAISIKFGIDQKIFRKLKLIHGIMHTFSIAVIVRKLINLFFKYIEIHSLIWLKKRMQRIKYNMMKIINKNRVYTKIQTGMVHMYGEELMMENILVGLSKNYTLLSIEFI